MCTDWLVLSSLQLTGLIRPEFVQPSQGSKALSIVIEQPVEARLVAAAPRMPSIPATLHYDRSDPFAVRMTFPAPATLEGVEVCWTFARELLASGLEERGGLRATYECGRTATTAPSWSSTPPRAPRWCMCARVSVRSFLSRTHGTRARRARAPAGGPGPRPRGAHARPLLSGSPLLLSTAAHQRVELGVVEPFGQRVVGSRAQQLPRGATDDGVRGLRDARPALIRATPSAASSATDGAPGPTITLSGPSTPATSALTVTGSTAPGTKIPSAPAAR